MKKIIALAAAALLIMPAVAKDKDKKKRRHGWISYNEYFGIPKFHWVPKPWLVGVYPDGHGERWWPEPGPGPKPTPPSPTPVDPSIDELLKKALGWIYL